MPINIVTIGDVEKKKISLKKFKNMTIEQKHSLYHELLGKFTDKDIDIVFNFLNSIPVSDMVAASNFFILKTDYKERARFVMHEDFKGVSRNVIRFKEINSKEYEEKINEFKVYEEKVNYNNHGAYI